MGFHKVIGIDLGTTYSAVSVWDNDKGDVTIIPSATGMPTVPSVVGLDAERKVIVGSPAQNNLINDPENTIIEIKRDMGVYKRKPDPQTDDPGEPKLVHFRGRDYLPQEISAFIIMELKRQAEAYIGEPIHDAVITVPAYFHEPQKGATEDAAHIAKLNVKRLLNEPTAAAVCFGADKIKDDDTDTHTYAVYDLGGGTFDVSIIEVKKDNISVVGTGGDPKLGGGDFDDRITGYVLQQIKEKHDVDLTSDAAIWARIKREAEMRKRELSAATTAMLNLPYLTAQLSVNIPITRAIFEEIIDDLLQNSLKCLDDAIESAKESNAVSRDDIEQVLLVGGSTRIPRIRKLIAEHMGLDEKDVRIDVNPDEVVSRGAAIVANEYNPSDDFAGKDIQIDMTDSPEGDVQSSQGHGLVLQDVTSHTLGLLEGESNFFPIIPKESRLPSESTKGPFINGGRAKEIPVMIFQGEDEVAFNNTLIGKLPIILPEEREEGYYKFEVAFTLNNDGLLHVLVKCLNDNNFWDTNIQCNVRASKEQIEESSKHIEDVMATDKDKTDDQANIPDRVTLPKPPAGSPPPIPKPPVSEPQPLNLITSESVTTNADILEPPHNTPDEFKHIASRSLDLLNQLSDSDVRKSLLSAYMSFIQAVQSGSPEMEDLGDELDDLSMKIKKEFEAKPSIPAPLAETPDDFKAIARRSFKLLSQLPPSEKRDKLLSVYRSFTNAVQTGSNNIEELGKELDDIFRECK